MTLENFYNLLKTMPIEDYIIQIRYKYDFEEKYRYTNELLLVGSNLEYEWLNDWWEGEQDISVVGYIAVSDIEEFKGVNNDNN